MAQYDGTLVIGTGLDTKGLERDLKALERDLEKSVKEEERLTKKKMSLEFDTEGALNKIKSLSDKIDLLEKKAQKLRDKGHEIVFWQRDDSNPEWARLNNEYEQIRIKVNELVDKEADLSDKRNLQLDELDEINQKLADNKIKQAEITDEIKDTTDQLEEADENAERVKNNMDFSKENKDFGKSLDNFIHKITRMGLAVIGIRSLYGMIFKSVNRLKEENPELASTIQTIQNAIDIIVEQILAELMPTIREMLPTLIEIANVVLNVIVAVIRELLPIIKFLLQVLKWIVEIIGDLLYDLFGIDVATNNFATGLNKANKSAKALRKQLMGFDEMNILNNDTGSTGVVKGLDVYGSNYKEPDPEPVKETANWWTVLNNRVKKYNKEFGNQLGEDQGKGIRKFLIENVPGWTILDDLFQPLGELLAKTGGFTYENYDYGNVEDLPWVKNFKYGLSLIEGFFNPVGWLSKFAAFWTAFWLAGDPDKQDTQPEVIDFFTDPKNYSEKSQDQVNKDTKKSQKKQIEIIENGKKKIINIEQKTAKNSSAINDTNVAKIITAFDGMTTKMENGWVYVETKAGMSMKMTKTEYDDMIKRLTNGTLKYEDLVHEKTGNMTYNAKKTCDNINYYSDNTRDKIEYNTEETGNKVEQTTGDMSNSFWNFAGETDKVFNESIPESAKTGTKKTTNEIRTEANNYNQNPAKLNVETKQDPKKNTTTTIKEVKDEVDKTNKNPFVVKLISKMDTSKMMDTIRKLAKSWPVMWEPILKKLESYGFAKGGIINVPRLASGGIINRPGRGVPLGLGGAIAGERGREAIVPLTDSQQMALLGREIAKNVVINLTSVLDVDGRQLARTTAKVMNEMNFASNGGVI